MLHPITKASIAKLSIVLEVIPDHVLIRWIVFTHMGRYYRHEFMTTEYFLNLHNVTTQKASILVFKCLRKVPVE